MSNNTNKQYFGIENLKVVKRNPNGLIRRKLRKYEKEFEMRFIISSLFYIYFFSSKYYFGIENLKVVKRNPNGLIRKKTSKI